MRPLWASSTTGPAIPAARRPLCRDVQHTFRKASEPDSIYSVTQGGLDETCDLYHGGKRLLRAIRERIGFRIEHHE